jgi:hypothetical protein
VLIDPEDLPLVEGYRWFLNRDGYVVNTDLGTYQGMHRMIMVSHFGNKPLDVDHIDRNKLNMQKSNLRFCTHMENCRNRRLSPLNKSGYPGIYFKPKYKKWQVNVFHDYHQFYVGQFNSLEDAVREQKAFREAMGLH